MRNRCVPHEAGRRVGTASWRHQRPICCRLSFEDRKREIMAPGRHIGLRVLDEAAAPTRPAAARAASAGAATSMLRADLDSLVI